MPFQDFYDFAIPFLPLVVTIITTGLILWGAHLFLIVRNKSIGNERLLPKQLVMLGLTVASILAIALSLPVGESSRNQIITLIGLVISGIIAFSSSTIFANLMAGLMLRVTKPFHPGDFIEVGNHFGRLVERGLLDTEIQTENRELVALPNTYLITNPITVTNSSGAVVTTELSLGYDIHHSQVESLLLAAARECELEEPFVQVLELGNNSITYKISGMLKDVKSLLTARSNLRRYVLDSLHGDNVEILSPAYMNQRKVPEGQKVIPKKQHQPQSETDTVAEQVVFDKAEQAEKIEKQKQALQAQMDEQKAALRDAPEDQKKEIKQAIKAVQDALKTLQAEPVEPNQAATKS